MSGFFNYTIDDVTNTVKASVDGFDNAVQGITGLMTFDLNGSDWGSVATVVKNVSTGISTIAVCMAVIYTYLAIVREGLTLRGDFKKVISIILRLCITKGLIDSATSIMFWIYSFGAKITNVVCNLTTGKSSTLTDVFKPEDVAVGLGLDVKTGVKGFDCFIALQYAKILGFFMWGLTIVLVIIGLSRIIKIYLNAMFSSIAFAKLPLEGYNGIKEYISSYIGLSLQGAVIVGAIAIYKICLSNIGIISSFYTDKVFGSFGTIVILSITLILTIAQSETIAKKFA